MADVERADLCVAAEVIKRNDASRLPSSGGVLVENSLTLPRLLKSA